LLWVHAFRGVAMQIFSARKFGFVVTAGAAWARRRMRRLRPLPALARRFAETAADLKRQFRFVGDSGAYHFLYVIGQPVPPYREWSAARGSRARRRGAAATISGQQTLT